MACLKDGDAAEAGWGARTAARERRRIASLAEVGLLEELGQLVQLEKSRRSRASRGSR